MPDGSPMEIMKSPVADVIQLCLAAEASDEEIFCAAVQVCILQFIYCSRLVCV
jgi:hypothetical protein